MIKAICKTNLDEYKYVEWPTSFVSLPREGDWVEAQNRNVLKVVKVTHAQEKDGTPFIRVELHHCVNI